jgi:hypothetical protein
LAPSTSHMRVSAMTTPRNPVFETGLHSSISHLLDDVILVKNRCPGYKSIHISASLPQWVHVAVPMTRFVFSGLSTAPDADTFLSSSSTSGNEHVTTISASLPQFLHSQTFLTIFFISNS